jgi:hypothetical protein
MEKETPSWISTAVVGGITIGIVSTLTNYILSRPIQFGVEIKQQPDRTKDIVETQEMRKVLAEIKEQTGWIKEIMDTQEKQNPALHLLLESNDGIMKILEKKERDKKTTILLKDIVVELKDFLQKPPGRGYTTMTKTEKEALQVASDIINANSTE